MKEITEQMISALAPNGAAAANGQKISQKGGFVKLEKSSDDTFYMGECTGSGKSNYITSADFADPAQPVFRCSCPSRQFPCKHSLGLLYEMKAGKAFGICEIPQDILQKRSKKQAREEKAAQAASETEGPAEAAGNGDGKKTEIKVNKGARTKKLKKQLEGLDLTAKLVSDLMNNGLGAMGGAALNTYKDLAKQLGDFYLPGPQRLLNRLILEIGAFQQDGADEHYEQAVQVLIRLQALVKKSVQYLTEKLDSGQVEQDDNLLYEELGGVWKLSELSALGLSKQGARLAQLSFWVTFDEARGEYIDTGCWADIETGEISVTQNYRPLKALKYVKQEDSVFGVAHVPEACYYPGSGNPRVRWDGAELSELTAADLERLRSLGSDLGTAVKETKNVLKNTMADPYFIKLVRFSQIGRTADGIALGDMEGATILLGDAPELPASAAALSLLPNRELLDGQTLLGAFYYDRSTGRIKLQPLSILGPEQVVRLLY